jgi:hypothetical protein
LKGTLEVERLSLWDLSEGNLEGGFLAGDPEGLVEKALETGICFYRGPAGEPGRGLIYRGLWEMDYGGSKNGASLLEEAQWRGPREGFFAVNPGRNIKKGSGYGRLSL